MLRLRGGKGEEAHEMAIIVCITLRCLLEVCILES